jgi:hypothetical protein
MHVRLKTHLTKQIEMYLQENQNTLEGTDRH